MRKQSHPKMIVCPAQIICSVNLSLTSICCIIAQIILYFGQFVHLLLYCSLFCFFQWSQQLDQVGLGQTWGIFFMQSIQCIFRTKQFKFQHLKKFKFQWFSNLLRTSCLTYWSSQVLLVKENAQLKNRENLKNPHNSFAIFYNLCQPGCMSFSVVYNIHQCNTRGCV